MTKHQHGFTIMMSALSAIVLLSGCHGPGQASAPTLVSLSSKTVVTDSQLEDIFQKTRLMLVGEHHTDPAHHAAQLAVIRFLSDRSIPVAIGLEMFRRDQQSALNGWVDGDMDEDTFKQIYLENWNFPWSLYRDIFVYARAHHIPMVGLNVSREITKQVAQNGFDSLSAKQRGELEGITCNVTREYRDFIHSAFGAHGHGNFDFIHFCEAQLVWDTAMAINAITYLNQHPEQTMVLLTGSGHARKMGIPLQFSSRSSLPLTVILPQTTGIFDVDRTSVSDADFIIVP